MIKTSLIRLMYFFLLTNYSNFVVCDEALALPDQFKKLQKQKLKKRTTLQKQTLARVP